MTRTRLLALPLLLLAVLAVPSAASAASAPTVRAAAAVGHPRVAADTAYGLSFSSPCRTRLVVRSYPWRTAYGIWSGGRLIARGTVGPVWTFEPRHTPGEVQVHNLPLKPNQKVTFQARPDWGTFNLTVYANPKPCRGTR